MIFCWIVNQWLHLGGLEVVAITYSLFFLCAVSQCIHIPPIPANVLLRAINQPLVINK